MLIRILIAIVIITSTPTLLDAHEEHKHKADAEVNTKSLSMYQYLDPGDTAPDFTLTNQDGKEVSLRKLKGTPIVLTPIYVSCPGACPLILHNREKIEKSLEKAIGKNPIFIALTVDPGHDTPEVLKEFITKIGVNPEKMHLLTGNPEKVNRVLTDYKIRIRIDAREGQVLGHSVMGYGIDSNGIVQKAIQFAQ